MSVPPDHDPKDHYGVLDISPCASRDEIHDAYRKKAKDYHPDTLVSSSVAFRALAEREFKKVQEAYEVLSDPSRRSGYEDDLRRDRDKKKADSTTGAGSAHAQTQTAASPKPPQPKGGYQSAHASSQTQQTSVNPSGSGRYASTGAFPRTWGGVMRHPISGWQALGLLYVICIVGCTVADFADGIFAPGIAETAASIFAGFWSPFDDPIGNVLTNVFVIVAVGPVVAGSAILTMALILCFILIGGLIALFAWVASISVMGSVLVLLVAAVATAWLIVLVRKRRSGSHSVVGLSRSVKIVSVGIVVAVALSLVVGMGSEFYNRWHGVRNQQTTSATPRATHSTQDEGPGLGVSENRNGAMHDLPLGGMPVPGGSQNDSAKVGDESQEEREPEAISVTSRRGITGTIARAAQLARPIEGDMTVGGAVWRVSLNIERWDDETQTFGGTLECPGLGTVLKVVGQAFPRRITFEDTEVVERGRGPINCHFDISRRLGSRLSGDWRSPNKDGSIRLSLPDDE